MAVCPAWAWQAAGPGATVGHAGRTQVEDWVLANRHLRVVVRPDNLTFSVDDLATKET